MLHRAGRQVKCRIAAAAACSFVPVDREQSYLMPPSSRDRLAEDRLARFVPDAASRTDLPALEANGLPDLPRPAGALAPNVVW
jgi:hypothetical protein